MGRDGTATDAEEAADEVGSVGFYSVVNNIFIAASSGEKRGVRKCNSEGCLPFPCMPALPSCTCEAQLVRLRKG